MNRRSQAMLRDYATELPARSRFECEYDIYPGEPVDMARMMAEHNNRTYGSRLDYTTECVQASDLTWYTVGYVFDTGGTPAGVEGGDVTMCWWQQILCPECEGYGYTEVFHPSTDALIGTRTCTQKHPAPPPPPPPAPAKHLEGCNGEDKIIGICCPPF